ncbi:MAG: helix-hairpin-helix domain-containing protein [Bacteriovoracaceae bacterium]
MTTEIVPQGAMYAVKHSGLPGPNVLAVLELILKEQCTVPFIARYRKEKTGAMDEVGIRRVQELYEEYNEIEKRREFILKEVKEQEKLTPELEKQIKAAATLNQLEDLYAPYKSKKKTKAMLAKEMGLEPLSKLLLTGKKTLAELEKELFADIAKIPETKIKTWAQAVDGACDILVEEFSHHLGVKEEIRRSYWTSAKFGSSKKDKAEEVEEFLKFKDFFEFAEPVKNLKDPKASHRYLAMRRGMNLKVLKLDIEGDKDHALNTIEKEFFSNPSVPNYDLLKKCSLKAFEHYVHPSLDLEIKTDLKKIADEAAIDVFGVNLKNLLLQPYLGAKAVLGVDPGIRTGCKVVIIDNTGKFVGDFVIYPHEPKKDVKNATILISKAIEVYNIEYVAIGNGTAGRETLAFFEENIEAVKSGAVKATLVSESGASIYSASDIAREEFPDKDVTVRGSISIARRFQDPLAELVKLDPKSIGVGQYQHDVNQIKLKKSLEGVVESCVNFVGVDLNTASAPLLSYVSGIGPTVAKNIVKYREDHKGFKTREDLLKVGRFSQKIYEQCAGFLRIYNGANPLDSTFIHPERYETLTKWAKKKNIDVKNLIQNKELCEELKKDKDLLAEVGEMTMQDIVKSLLVPSQDPRTVFKSVEFSKDISTMEDLKLSQWYTGVVTNITMFGAFVDIGIKENGLLHISEISDGFTENAMDKLKVGQELKVKVIGVDKERKRVSLSCKTGESKAAMDPGYTQGTQAPRPRADRPMPNNGGGGGFRQPEAQIKNNAFAGLKNLRLK